MCLYVHTATVELLLQRGKVHRDRLALEHPLIREPMILAKVFDELARQAVQPQPDPEIPDYKMLIRAGNVF